MCMCVAMCTKNNETLTCSEHNPITPKAIHATNKTPENIKASSCNSRIQVKINLSSLKRA